MAYAFLMVNLHPRIQFPALSLQMAGRTQSFLSWENRIPSVRKVYLHIDLCLMSN